MTETTKIVLKVLAWAFSGIAIMLIPPIRRFFVRTYQRVFRREFIPDGIDFHVRPISSNDYQRVSEMANYYLGKGHGIAPRSVELWSNKNEEMFLIIECKTMANPNWSFCGYYSVLPISPAAASLLRQSKIQDYDLTEDVFLSFDDPNLEEIFIMDLMTNFKKCEYHHCCKIAGKILILKLREFVRALRTRNPHLKTVFTIVASRNGERLAERTGFSQRIDFESPFGWKLYENEIGKV